MRSALRERVGQTWQAEQPVPHKDVCISRASQPTLADIGLTPNESSRYQRLAAISEPDFEADMLRSAETGPQDGPLRCATARGDVQVARDRETRCAERFRAIASGRRPAGPRVDEVKNLRDKAEAMAAYARQAKDTELIQHATEIKVRAERRCGEMLRETEKRTGGHAMKARSDASTEVPPTLADMGISKDESSRYQKLAAMTEESFETAVATAKATAGEVTTAYMLRITAA